MQQKNMHMILKFVDREDSPLKKWMCLNVDELTEDSL